jgi:hypothetical protein
MKKALIAGLTLLLVAPVSPARPELLERDSDIPALRVTVLDRGGDAVSDVAVSLFLEPFGESGSYRAPLIARGTSDHAGHLSLPLSPSKLVANSGRSAGGVVNATVVATDFSSFMHAARAVLLSPNKTKRVTLRLTAQLDKSALVSQSAMQQMGGSQGDSGTTKIGEKRRPVRVTHQHLGRGVNGRFCFLNGRDTYTEIAVRLQAGSSWGPWEASGWRRESKSRTYGSCAPSSAAKPRGRRGPFHELWLASYKYYKYRVRVWQCDPASGSCIPTYRQEWRPHHWTGGMRLAKGVTLDQPRRRAANSIRLPRNRDFWKDARRNTRFGFGVSIAGIRLESQAGYSSITKLWWLSTRRCRRNYLYGGGTDPGDARGPIYSKSRGC